MAQQTYEQLQCNFYSRKTLLSVFRDRGYITDESVYRFIFAKFGKHGRSAHALLEEGGWSLDQILLLGHYLEMTPAEFCGCFLNGYICEDELGHFSCRLSPEVLKAAEEKRNRKKK